MPHDSIGLFHVAKAIHPVVSPFTYYCSYQSRTLRFSTYHSQVCVMVILMLVFFGRRYRQLDHRFEEVLDLADIQAVSYSVLLGSIWLIPTFANIFNYVLEDKETIPKRSWMRGIFYIVFFVLNFIIVLVAVYTAY